MNRLLQTAMGNTNNINNNNTATGTLRKRKIVDDESTPNETTQGTVHLTLKTF